MFAKCSLIYVLILLKYVQGLLAAFTKLEFLSLASDTVQGLPVTYLLSCTFPCSPAKADTRGSQAQCHNGPVGEGG